MPGPARPHRLSPWGRLVAVSAVLVYGSGLALLVGNLATREDRVTEYRVRGTLQGVDLDLGNGSVEVLRGGPRAVLTVRNTGRSAYGHRATMGRSIADGVLRVRSRCPDTVLRSCSVAYRLVVPDNVPVDVRTDTGAVRFRDYRGSARVRTRQRRRRRDGLLRLLAAGAGGERQPRGADVVPAAAALAAVDLRRRPRGGAHRPLPGRGRERLGRPGRRGRRRDDRRARSASRR